MSRGIDYGMGQTNIDHATGIRYGVINANALSPWFWESTEADYGDPACPKCGGEVLDTDARQDEIPEAFQGDRDYFCPHCEASFWSDRVFGDEPIGHTLDVNGFKGEVSTDGDVFLTKSPFFTRAQFCSPCAPGACHLEHPADDGDRCYCFDHEWFDGDQAPYPVYRVDTGELVPPPVK